MSDIITVNNIKYKYNIDDDHLALNDVSFSVKQGEWLSIVGPNGSGKSTLAKTLNGLIAPQEGSVQVDGLDLTMENVWDIRQRVGMVFQNPDNQFVGATVQDDVAFGLENLGVPRPEMIERIEHALAQVGMTDFAEKEPARLSGGQKQRVAIAGIVALKPKIMILDEATSMLDPRGRREVLQTVKEVKERENLTVLSITHDVDEAAASDRVLVMKGGQIIDHDKPEAIFSQTKNLMSYGLDVPFPERLKQALAQENIKVPDNYLTKEGLIDWLWTSVSKM
ncbi:energy-coupling factor transporter ATPase [Dolosigranulum pigrum]|uniref:Cobalt ABC transporter, ATP-binding protein n=1 Tax=Dolosigranulum pigrum ATCC 51524 TaxID=883103 RepID=H3NCL8_9LACT|nr:energy-coupling factor ABC transporter ATP-binding protein [Dolosigranulum pigrum]EHR34894.1 cobalt ABC transporter, ATP-binding protein [Dolosigranulum pigrum ATCC 51524]QJS95511.1 energy-coupling factor ABC transporter ATP-binding protein [Dolosigranulum pigrum]QTJ51116.1 energy-coupling factor ABC transporter ATP-binding protein [Dolosigranulum pigrum]RAN52346.1 energy-coupling factor transporter ATPase [Dolosigranulum pigrum]RAN60273.1 energy-coupling factor transporter ATPase [Dolosigr